MYYNIVESMYIYYKVNKERRAQRFIYKPLYIFYHSVYSVRRIINYYTIRRHTIIISIYVEKK